MLSPRLLEVLRAWWRQCRSQGWLFPSRDPFLPITARQRQQRTHALQQFPSPLGYSITSSASARSVSGTVRPSALAVLTLIISSNFVGCWTGRPFEQN
jgi:hypothetical protein